MKMTHQDLINHLKKIDVEYSIEHGYVHAKTWVKFYTISSEFTELPNNIVFNGICDLDFSSITSIPDNIVFNGSLSISDTKITELPSKNPVYIHRHLYMNNNKSVIPFGTYVGSRITAYGTFRYEHYQAFEIGGYFVIGGIIS